MGCLLCLAAWLASPETQSPGEERAADLRALRGYLELYRNGIERAAGVGADRMLPSDLCSRLQAFMDRSDLTADNRADAIAIYRELAHSLAAGQAALRPAAGGRSTGGFGPRELYFDLIRRAEAAGIDVVPLELELLSCRQVGLDADETYRRLLRLRPRLSGERALPPAESALLREVLERLLSERDWPSLDAGPALSGTVDLLLSRIGDDPAREGRAIIGKLAEWTARLLKSEAAREGELAQGTALIHLYESLALTCRALPGADPRSTLEGLVMLEPPVLAGGRSGSDGALTSVDVSEVRLPTGGREKIPPLSSQVSPAGPGYLLVPRKFYQVQLVCSQESGPPRTFAILARAGSEARLVLPAAIPNCMTPVTLPDSGRLAFLADRKPWTIRRFLQAFQRSWNNLADKPLAVSRIYSRSALREIPLAGGAEPTFAGLVELLTSAEARDRLEETFWVEATDNAGQSAVFEISTAVLSANTGLRDTTLSLPTVAEANRLWREGERFGLEEPGYGLFNATRLVPDGKELGVRPRYVIRTVQRLPSP